MKITLILITSFLFIFTIPLAADDDQSDFEMPAGMEILELKKGHYAAVPKDLKKHWVGNRLVLESKTEYTARRFSELEERIALIESDNKTLREEIKILKQNR